MPSSGAAQVSHRKVRSELLDGVSKRNFPDSDPRWPWNASTLLLGPLQALVGRRLIARRPMDQTANESGRIHYTNGPWRVGVSGVYGV